MRCLRVRLVTGLSGAQGISRDDNKTIPRGPQGVEWLTSRLCGSRKLRRAKKAARSAKGRARVRKDTGSALKARTKI